MPIQLSGVQLGNIPGGPTAIKLSDLRDVSINVPQTGQYLRYNAGILEWQNAFLTTDVFSYLNTNLTSTGIITLVKDSGLDTILIGSSLTADGDVDTITTTSSTLNLILKTVNSNVGTFGSGSEVPVVTVNAKGLITGITTEAVASAGSAGQLTTARNISTTGDASWTVLFDGSADVSNPITLATVNAGPVTAAFQKITTNGKGLVTATSAVMASDITTSLGYTPVNKAGDTMTGNLILNADPTTALGATTKQYVDNIAAGLSAKASAITATNGVNLTATYSNGVSGVGATLTGIGSIPAIGGITPVAGNRVLIKNQTASLQNGIYTVTVVTPNWVLTRSTDFDNSPSGEVAAGDYVFVQTGALAGTSWVQITPDPITIGTTAIVWTQFAGAGTYTAGTGLSLTGTTFANTGVTGVVAGAGISVSSATGNVTITASGGVPATTAQTLTPGRTINTVLFDGSTNIVVTAAAGTLTGTTLNSTVVTSSLTTVGTLVSLNVTGAIVAGGDVTAFSDARVKTNVLTISNALDKVKKIRGVTFERADTPNDTSRHTGVIAQEIEPILPEVVNTDPKSGMKSVAYGNISGLLIEALKEMSDKVDALTAKIKELEDKLITNG